MHESHRPALSVRALEVDGGDAAVRSKRTAPGSGPTHNGQTDIDEGIAITAAGRISGSSVGSSTESCSELGSTRPVNVIIELARVGR